MFRTKIRSKWQIEGEADPGEKFKASIKKTIFTYLQEMILDDENDIDDEVLTSVRDIFEAINMPTKKIKWDDLLPFYVNGYKNGMLAAYPGKKKETEEYVSRHEDDLAPVQDWGAYLPVDLAKKMAEIEGMKAGRTTGTAFKYYADEDAKKKTDG